MNQSSINITNDFAKFIEMSISPENTEFIYRVEGRTGHNHMTSFARQYRSLAFGICDGNVSLNECYAYTADMCGCCPAHDGQKPLLTDPSSFYRNYRTSKCLETSSPDKFSLIGLVASATGNSLSCKGKTCSCACQCKCEKDRAIINRAITIAWFVKNPNLEIPSDYKYDVQLCKDWMDSLRG
jgi:hypothetical protein